MVKFWGLFQKGYVILHNVGSRFELTLTIFAKVDGFEKFKIVTCSSKSRGLGNVAFEIGDQ